MKSKYYAPVYKCRMCKETFITEKSIKISEEEIPIIRVKNMLNESNKDALQMLMPHNCSEELIGIGYLIGLTPYR